MISYYNNEAEYLQISGHIVRYDNKDDGRVWWGISFDGEIQGTTQSVSYENWTGGGFSAVPTNNEILKSRGFYNVIPELLDGKYGEILSNVIISFITVYRSWLDGWSYPILELKIGHEVYLDIETGKEIFLNWIRF